MDPLVSPTYTDCPNQVVSVDDIFIIVMGITGSGKSTFISQATKEPTEVCHGLESSIAGVTMYPFIHKNKCVHLIDTPGFNDTTRADVDTLREIAYWLTKSYSLGIQVSGIAYLQAISAPRLAGAALKNLTMFKKLCGVQNSPGVVFATTMWDVVPQDLATARQRELVSNTHFWGEMVSRGSLVHPHSAAQTSALAIIGHIVGKNSRYVLDIQHEMVDKQKYLHDTNAGKEMGRVWLAQREEFQRRTDRMLDDHQEAVRNQGRQQLAAIQEERRRFDREIKDIDANNDALKNMQITTETFYKEYEEKLRLEIEDMRLAAAKRREVFLQKTQDLQRQNQRYLDGLTRSQEPASVLQRLGALFGGTFGDTDPSYPCEHSRDSATYCRIMKEAGEKGLEELQRQEDLHFKAQKRKETTYKILLSGTGTLVSAGVALAPVIAPSCMLM